MKVSIQGKGQGNLLHANRITNLRIEKRNKFITFFNSPEGEEIIQVTWKRYFTN